ncbi:GspE/PulE family protein [Zavarzinia sp. CC-PAN008]|uniref:GspE/PulE family protein n=1 Tax=Zavarzinia sp. CC-PAN008 TaxID=3243332 RepID=UPI003F74723F
MAVSLADVPSVPEDAPPARAPLPIGAILLQAQAIGEDDLRRALSVQRAQGGRLGTILIRLGALGEDALLEALSRQLGLDVLPPEALPADAEPFLAALRRAGYEPEWWLDQHVLAWDDGLDGRVNVIARDPLAPSLQESLEAAFPEHPLRWWLIASPDLDRALELVDQGLRHGTATDELSHLIELAEEAPVVELVASTLAQAFAERASDVHFEPAEQHFQVRFRIDGVLQTRVRLPRSRYDAVASRIKLISGMDIAERRLPQDGRLSQRISGQVVDIRASALPGTWGESLVLRLLPKERQQYRLDRLGMAPDHLATVETLIRQPHGIVLVTGPTGSGKSTTLYAAIEAINDGRAKIITVEDPVEYDIAGVNQVQVHAEIGYDFARALRSILRQDPDILMIGEIRDRETAEIAVQASLTGHLVFSTLHTNDVFSAFVRLTDIGVEPFLVSASVSGVVAQRLVRLLCADCAVPDDDVPAAIEAEAASLLPPGAPPPAWRRAVGCKACQGIGHRGRIGLYEVLAVDTALRDLVARGAPTSELRHAGQARGFRSLRADGLLKARAGLTSLDEVLRVTGLGTPDPL